MVIDRRHLILGAWVLASGVFMLSAGEAADSSEAKRFSFVEVMQWVETHWDDVDQERIEGAALKGLAREFEGRLLFNDASEGSDKKELPDSEQAAKLFQDDVLYVHPKLVGKGLVERIKTAHSKHASDDGLKGLVLDLRFSQGRDYRSAAKAAGLFLGEKGPALKWDDKVARTGKGEAIIDQPVAVLVNESTLGAAEALTALLREGGAAVVIGSKTAGRAYIFETIRLDSGRELQIAREPVTLGDGTDFSTNGIVPDIEVAVSEADERAYLKDPYRELTSEDEASEARGPEADPLDDDGDSQAPKSEKSERPVIRDPVLARAVDLLKGISLVRQLGSD